MIYDYGVVCPQTNESGCFRLRRWFTVAALGLVLALASAVPAFAYQESSSTVDPAATPASSCPTCHGLEAEITSPTVAPTRKGPHGGYTSGTNKCSTCHTVHGAASYRSLLPEATIVGTCNTCHDGTGGGGVYGVIKQRTGLDPGGQHGVGSTSVPGGNPEGGAINVTFTGESGGLTCTDCHSPHDSETVAPFIGDRLRSSADTTSAKRTNRLLKQMPTSAETTSAAYGTEWCIGCHKGSHSDAEVVVQNHPVGDSSDGLDYMNVYRMSAYDSPDVDPELGPLGGDNLGYVVPRTTPPTGALPICQQCHEDSRKIGNLVWQVVSSEESFTPTSDGIGNGNPRFQNFPHETVNAQLLVELETGGAKDTLCLNCHRRGGGATPGG